MKVDRKTELHVHIVDIGRSMAVLADEIREQLISGEGLAAYGNLRTFVDYRRDLDANLNELADLLGAQDKILDLPKREAAATVSKKTSSGTFPRQGDVE